MRRVAPQSTVPRTPDGACPMRTFSETLRSGNSRGSWWTTAMPSSRARAGPWMTVGSPSRVIVPRSGWWMPARILTSVLLPAPFSPTSAWTSRGRRSRSTPSSAWVAPKRIVMSRSEARTTSVSTDGGHASASGSTRLTSIPFARQLRDHLGRGLLVGEDAVDVVDLAERGERRPLPLRVVDDRDDVARDRDHRPLDLGLFLGRVAQARVDREPGGAHERGLDVDPVEQAVAELADDRHRLPADAATGHQDGDPRRPRQLRGEPKPVGDDGQLAPAAVGPEAPRDGEGRGARVHDDRFAVPDEGRGGRADARLLGLLETLAQVERRFRAMPFRVERAPVRAHDAPFGLEDDEILADRDGRDREAGGQVPDPHATAFTHQSSDRILSLAGKDIPGCGACRDGHTDSPLGARPRRPGVSGRVPAHLRPKPSAMSRNRIEINRNLWHAVPTDRTRPVFLDTTRSGGDVTSSDVVAGAGRTAGPEGPTIVLGGTHGSRVAGGGHGGEGDERVGDPRRTGGTPDRAPVVGVRQLRDAVQGVRPARRPARSVREGRGRRRGPPRDQRHADRGPPHPVGQGRRLRRPRAARRRRAAWRWAPSTRTRSRTTTTCSGASATRTRACGARPSTTSSNASTSWTRPGLATSSCGSRTEPTIPGRTTSEPARTGSPRRSRPSTPGWATASGWSSSTSSSSRRSTRPTCPTGGRRWPTASRSVRRRSSWSTPATTRRGRTSSSSSRHCCAPGSSAPSTSTRASTPTTT